MTWSRGRFPFGLTVASLIALALLLGLGQWQVQRLHWKEGLLAKIAALQHAPARPLATVLARIGRDPDLDYVRVLADCPQIERSAFVRLYTVRDAMPGFRIITACRLGAGPYGAILVDRGFMPQDGAGGASPPPGEAIDGPVIGVLRQAQGKTFVTPDNQPADRLFYSRDIPAMAAVLGAARPAPTFLMLERPAPKAGLPIPAPVPLDIPNNHLEYAVTWFGLAGALACVYLATLWRRLRSQ
jgi:surfeit locus 1 family protein